MSPDVTDSASPASAVAAFRGTVPCRRFANALTLAGPAADSADDELILSFIVRDFPALPESLTAPVVVALDEQRYRIVSLAGEWVIEATSLHVHRDIGNTFYRAIPPRPAPLAKRFFWRLVLALAGSRAGKRLLLSLRRR